MKKIRIVVIPFLLLTCMFLICGCWNYKELDRMFIVMGAAVDKDSKTGNYVLTIETMTPRGAKDTTMVTQIVSTEGVTIFDAARNAIKKAGRKMYWGHAAVWIISKKVAEEGIVPAIDMISRSKETRPDILVIVSNTGLSSQVFSKTNRLNTSVSKYLYDMFSESKSAGKYRKVPLWQAINDMSDRAVSLTLPLIDIDKKASDLQVGTSKSAIFRGEKMVGEINGIETRSTLILRRELKNGFVLALPANKEDKLPASSLEVTSSTTKIIVNSNGGKPEIYISSILNGNIIEIQSSIDYFTETNRLLLEKEYADLLKEQMKTIILKAQKEFNLDIFGFGKEVRIQKQGIWKSMENNWDDNFKNLECSIDVKVKINGSGLEMKPTKVGGD